MPVYPDEERGTYYFICWVPTADGPKQVKRRGFETQREARVAEAKMVADAEEGLYEEENPTFDYAANKYLKWYKRRRKASSYTKIESLVRIHLVPQFKGKKLNEIRPRDITNFQDELLDRELSVSHIKRIHQALSATFNFAIRQEYTKENPARIAGNIDIEDDKHINFWTLEEFRQFIEHVDDFMYYVLFMVLYYSGMRKGELLALTWADIDFENNTINVGKTVYHRVVTSPKNKTSIRKILMPKFVMRFLSQLKAKQKNFKINYVVFGEFYDHIPETTIDVRYNSFVKLSGVKRIRLHDFRHSHASYLINRGEIPSVVADRLGHSDVATTLNTYSHLYPTKEKEAVSRMEDDFKSAEIIEFKAKKQ